MSPDGPAGAFTYAAASAVLWCVLPEPFVPGAAAEDQATVYQATVYRLGVTTVVVHHVVQPLTWLLSTEVGKGY